MSTKQKIILIVGHSASGKDFLIKKLKEEKYPIQKIKTTTTRPIREDEQHLKQDQLPYFFLTPEQFRQALEQGEFLEHTEYAHNFYGLSKKSLQNALKNSNSISYLILDPSGHQKVSQFCLENQIQPITFFLTIDTKLQIERLKSRQQNISPEELYKRVESNIKFSEYFSQQSNSPDTFLIHIENNQQNFLQIKNILKNYGITPKTKKLARR